MLERVIGHAHALKVCHFTQLVRIRTWEYIGKRTLFKSVQQKKLKCIKPLTIKFLFEVTAGVVMFFPLPLKIIDVEKRKSSSVNINS